MTFEAALAQLELDHPIGMIADSFPITLGVEPPIRPATASPDAGSMDHTITVDDGHKRARVNTDRKRWTHVRVPVQLAERLTALGGEALIAHGEGRITLPNSMVQFVPAWWVIERALDEQAARRERSARPRRRPR